MNDTTPGEELHARRMSKEAVGPESPLERQESITQYLIRRQRDRRDRFMRRSAAFSLRKELGRNLFLASCLLFDVLVAPYPLFLIPGAWGWVGAGIAIPVALYAEYRVYGSLFAVPASPDVGPPAP